MKTLTETLEETAGMGKALGHFNVSDWALLDGIFGAARAMNVPLLIGASEGEREFLGTRQIAAVVRSLREEFYFPVFLNADHTHSVEKALEAAEAGFDAVVFDLSSLPLEENIRATRQAVEALKSVRPSILIEGEIGNIGTGSEVRDEHRATNSALTTPAEAQQFVEETRVDILAPAVGNAHGMSPAMARGELKQHLQVERIQEIKASTNTFLTLHGASGTEDEDLTSAIRAGINIIHINTELRLAWRQGIEKSLMEQQHEVAPYKILSPVVAAVQSSATSRLALFNQRV